MWHNISGFTAVALALDPGFWHGSASTAFQGTLKM
jgi:hypothetical protein